MSGIVLTGASPVFAWHYWFDALHRESCKGKEAIALG
jgi:hypothetical protein